MKIIILNGPSSTGKTSIIKELQRILSEPYLTTGLDNVIYMMPEKLNDYQGDLKTRDGFGWIEEQNSQGKYLYHLTPGQYGLKVYNMLKKQVKFLADDGFNVIVDHVALIKEDYALWRNQLKPHALLFVGLTAADEVLEQRELNRGDRKVGSSLALKEKVHSDFIYDITIDTSNLSPCDAALKIHSELFDAEKCHFS